MSGSSWSRMMVTKGPIIAQVAVLQMNMDSKVVTTMKEINRLFLPVPANRRILSASLLWIPTFYE